MAFESVTSPSKLREIMAKHPVVVTVFTGLACPACAMYRPVLEKLAELVPELPVVEYIVDYDPKPALELGILGTPTTVVYVDGEPVEGFAGAVDLPDLLEYLAEFLRGRRLKLAEKLRSKLREAKPVLTFM